MPDRRKYLKIGSYTPPDENGNGEKMDRKYYRQGYIFKDEEAFYDTKHPDKVCYIPETSDTKYTRNTILRECNYQTKLAEEVFEALDWQHISSLLENWNDNGKLDEVDEGDED